MQYKETIKNEVNRWLENLNEHTVRDVVRVIDIMDADFVNNKKPTFNILIGISCTFKCCQETDGVVCQNKDLAQSQCKLLYIDEILDLYNIQEIVHTITFQGLEPLDNLYDLLSCIYFIRKEFEDEIFIWTGYTEDECEYLINMIKCMGWKNIVIKFGRYQPNNNPQYDDILGVQLASNNQYAKRIV